MGDCLDVPQHPLVDRRNETAGRQRPIGLREQRHDVLGPPFETGTAAGQRDQSELPVGRSEVPVEVRRVHMAVRAPLAHGRRLRRDVESQPAILLPDRDRLDEAARGEVAVAGRPHAGPDDARRHRRRHARAERPFAGRRQLRKANDVTPHDRRGRVDLDDGQDLVGRRALPRAHEHYDRREQRSGEERPPRAAQRHRPAEDGSGEGE